MDNTSKSSLAIKETNIIFFSDNVYKISNEKSIKKKLDTSIERDVAQVFFNILQEQNSADFLTSHISLLFESLQIPKSFTKLTLLKHYKNLVIDIPGNTKVVDFDKMLHYIHKLLIFMENQTTILEYWKLVLFNIASKQEKINCFSNIDEYNWFMEVINVKELRSIKEMEKLAASMEKGSKKECVHEASDLNTQTFLLALKMLKVASITESFYITYIDFAHLLGKLGLLNY